LKSGRDLSEFGQEQRVTLPRRRRPFVPLSFFSAGWKIKDRPREMRVATKRIATKRYRALTWQRSIERTGDSRSGNSASA
jgi:hypothetical protein